MQGKSASKCEICKRHRRENIKKLYTKWFMKHEKKHLSMLHIANCIRAAVAIKNIYPSGNLYVFTYFEHWKFPTWSVNTKWANDLRVVCFSSGWIWIYYTCIVFKQLNVLTWIVAVDNFIGHIVDQRRSQITWIGVYDIWLANRFGGAQCRARRAFGVFGHFAMEAIRALVSVAWFRAFTCGTSVVIVLESVFAHRCANILIAFWRCIKAAALIDCGHTVASDQCSGAHSSFDFVSTIGLNTPTHQSIARTLTRRECTRRTITIRYIATALTIAQRQQIRQNLMLMTIGNILWHLTMLLALATLWYFAALLQLRTFQVVRTWRQTVAECTDCIRCVDGQSRVGTHAGFLEYHFGTTADTVIVARLHHTFEEWRAAGFSRIGAAQEWTFGVGDFQRCTGWTEIVERTCLATCRHWWAWFTRTLDLHRLTLQWSRAFDVVAGIATLTNGTTAIGIATESRWTEHSAWWGWTILGQFARGDLFATIAFGAWNASAHFVDAPTILAAHFILALDFYEGTGFRAFGQTNACRSTGIQFEKFGASRLRLS